MILPSALNNATVGGEIIINDVWSVAEKNQILLQVEEIHKIHGLSSGNPMTVTPTSRVVDDITQTITGDGETTTTVTRA